MVIPMSEKLVRKPRNVKINPDALHRAQVEALREKKALSEWLEEAIEEKIQRAKRRLNTVPVKRIPYSY